MEIRHPDAWNHVADIRDISEIPSDLAGGRIVFFSAQELRPPRVDAGEGEDPYRKAWDLIVDRYRGAPLIGTRLAWREFVFLTPAQPAIDLDELLEQLNSMGSPLRWGAVFRRLEGDFRRLVERVNVVDRVPGSAIEVDVE